MIATRTVEAIRSVRLGRSTLVWSTPDTVYKLFWGSGGGRRQPEEAIGSERAKACPVWSGYCLPAVPGRVPRLLRSRRGHTLDTEQADPALLEAWTKCRLLEAAAVRPFTPAWQLIEVGKLRTAFGQRQFDEATGQVCAVLNGLLLPAGPVHGDLHRGNMVAAGQNIFLIDWDRYNPHSSPLFDLVHFLLNERRRTRRLRWVPLLIQSEDLLAASLQHFGAPHGRVASVALAYAFNRTALEAYDARLKGQSVSRFVEFARQITAAFLDRALSETRRAG